jgi:predicted TIM-barrel fold metal-dependent hydrolase
MDCHFNIFGPFDTFPMSPCGCCTAPEALVPCYLQVAETIGIELNMLVQESIHGIDNAVTLDAISQIGLPRAHGAAVIEDSLDAATLNHLHDQGIRDVRFNLISGNGTLACGTVGGAGAAGRAARPAHSDLCRLRKDTGECAAAGEIIGGGCDRPLR